MSRLHFKDIGDDWTPSAISIVDQPGHPLAVFEVYENDDEFVKKSLDLEGEIMVEEKQEQMVSGPASFFEKIFGKTNVVVKSEETPAEPKPAEGNESDDKILEAISKLEEKIDKMDERITKLEDGGEEGEESPADPTDESGVVTKSDETNNPTDGVVTKSREVDPDSITVTQSEKSVYERMGRDSNGMTW